MILLLLTRTSLVRYFIMFSTNLQMSLTALICCPALCLKFSDMLIMIEEIRSDLRSLHDFSLGTHFSDNIWAMCQQRSSYRGVQGTLHSAAGSNYSKSRASGMEYESDWMKHRISSAFTTQVIRSATSFMPWCCKIPIGDGFHEFL
ncbi:hypothetical protein QQP08_007497 [Theobroma cacao]|nr:hypothetical protein QQP08_007497 [Theobroma cacao]